MTQYSTAEQRRIAIGAARHQLRKLGKNPAHCSAQDAWEVLSDLYYTEPSLIAVQWLQHCTPSQERLFTRDWNRDARRARDLEASIEAMKKWKGAAA